jgi:hypothetical protein
MTIARPSFGRTTMIETVGRVALVLLILVSAVKAIRRDPRFDRREVAVQIAWIVIYMAASAGFALLAWRVPGVRSLSPVATTLLIVGWAALTLVVLARYLQRRLARRDGARQADGD